MEYQSFTCSDEFNPYYRSDYYSIEFFTGFYSKRANYLPKGWPTDISSDLNDYYETFQDEIIEAGQLNLSEFNDLLKYYKIKVTDLNIFIQCIYKILETLSVEYGEKTRLVYCVTSD